MTKTVIVIGSGVIGASFAYHLAKAGAEVKVLEAGALAGAATPQSWAWINASWGNAKPYFDLRQKSMSEWKRCDREVPGLTVNWSGSILWDLPPDKLQAHPGDMISS
jgi:glycine/D-amino acid oxidase-like deaminating enzyme